jgi:hypothetical protein
MNDNIIYDERMTNSNRADAKEAERIARVASVHRLRIIEGGGEGKKGLIFARSADRAIAARAVGAIFEKAKLKGYPINEVELEVGGRTHGRYRLAADIDLSAPEGIAKAKNLLHAVRGYLNIAQKIAEMIGLDSDDTKIGVLRGTSLWSSIADKTPHNVDERSWYLAASLKYMVEQVVNDTQLIEFFGKARRIPGQFDVLSYDVRWASMSCLYQSIYQDWYEHWSEAPFLPSIPLVRIYHDSLDREVIIDQVISGDSVAELNPFFEDIRQPTQQAQFAAKESKIEMPDHTSARFRLFREIRLAIGPMASPNEFGPMFESRGFIDVILSDGEDSHAFNWFPHISLEAEKAGYGFIEVNGAWRKLEIISPNLDEMSDAEWRAREKFLTWTFGPDSTNLLDYEHWYFSWTPVDERHVSYWLDHERIPDVNYSLTRAEPEVEGQELWFPSGVLARDIEKSLLSGQLRVSIEGEIGRMKILLEQREKKWREGAKDTHRSVDVTEGISSIEIHDEDAK